MGEGWVKGFNLYNGIISNGGKAKVFSGRNTLLAAPPPIFYILLMYMLRFDPFHVFVFL